MAAPTVPTAMRRGYFLFRLTLVRSTVVFQPARTLRGIRARTYPVSHEHGDQDEVHVDEGDLKNESQQRVSEEEAEGMLRDVVTPLWSMPYKEQLELKYQQSCDVLKELTGHLRRLKTPIKTWKKEMPCRVAQIQPSPVTEAYRNKDEFSVRCGPDGNPKTVGFFTGSPATGNPLCVRPDQLINTRESHKRMAHIYEKYIQASPLPACDRLDDGGHWRNLIVRSNEKGDIMAVVVMHPQDMTREGIEEEKEKLKEHFLEQEPGITSLYFQACRHTRCTHEQAPFELLHGDPYLVEELDHLKFRISPDSFFQVNTMAARVLYKTVLGLSGVTRMSSVLDVCCGTGTISLYMSSYVRGCAGVEVVADAVRDAWANAEANGIDNVEFVRGRAEDKIPRLLKDLESSPDIVAIVNPARAGLHPHVVQTLRNCPQIQRLVYVSCKPEGVAMQNFVQLCKQDSKQKALPFVPRLAVPVDMFPHTKHCELVIVFERQNRNHHTA